MLKCLFHTGHFVRRRTPYNLQVASGRGQDSGKELTGINYPTLCSRLADQKGTKRGKTQQVPSGIIHSEMFFYFYFLFGRGVIPE